MEKLIEKNRKMDEKYWDSVAQDYDGEIFSALANDVSGVITSKIIEFGSKKSTACDFGCGVGKFLPILSENFRYVYALDISQECLEQARENCSHLTNISYSKVDLSEATAELRKVHFALCVNVAILASEQKRAGIIGTICENLYCGGHLLFVVPSLESALYSDFRLVQWNLKTGLTHSQAVSGLKETANDTDLPLRQGIIDIDGVPTKHYLKEELVALFADLPFKVLAIEKVEYAWETEFDGPPEWMNEPYPWDWLILLEKTRTRRKQQIKKAIRD